MSNIDQERLAHVSGMRLGSGAHAGIAEGASIMEAVAYVAGEPWSDRPKCACQVITAVLLVLNDGLPDAERNALLLPLIPRLIGTRGSRALARRRARMAADWLLREHLPAWLRLAGLAAPADALTSLPGMAPLSGTGDAAGAAADAGFAAAEVAARAVALGAVHAAGAAVTGDKARLAALKDTDLDTAWQAVENVSEPMAWDVAWGAATTAAGAAADIAPGEAAWDIAAEAAGHAALAAAWGAGRIAAEAARGGGVPTGAAAHIRGNADPALAWVARRAAALQDSNWAGVRDAALHAAEAALNPTRDALRASALALVDRMIAAPEDDAAARSAGDA